MGHCCLDFSKSKNDFRALWVKAVLCGTEKMKLAILDFSADCKSEQAKKKFAPFLLSMQVSPLCISKKKWLKNVKSLIKRTYVF